MRLIIALTIALALFVLSNRAAVAAEAAANGAGDAPAGEGKPPLVKLETSMGDILLELNRAKAPITVENFLSYVEDGFYDGTIFHRVINGFMVQGGGMDANMKEKPTKKPIKNEAANGLTNDTYTVAMARTNDPHSASAQFFINVKNNAFLNHRAPNADGYGYAVFGKVVDGMDVVDRIKAVPTGRVGFHDDVPRTPVVIKHAVIVRK